MKKITLLVAVALCATGVNAQTETWNASSIKKVTPKLDKDGNPEKDKDGNIIYDISVDETQITTAENTFENIIIHDEDDPLPWPGWLVEPDANGKNGVENETDPNTVTATSDVKLLDLMIKAKTENVEMTFTITPNIGDNSKNGAFSYGINVNPQIFGSSNKSLSTDKCSPKFLDYIKGKSGNAAVKHVEWWEKNKDGDIVHKYHDDAWTLEETTAPAISANINFNSKCKGTIKVGVFVNKQLKNNPVYVLKVAEDRTYTALSPSELKYEGYINNNTTDWFTGNPTDSYVVKDESNPFLGYLSFSMEQGEDYMIFIPKNQIGLYGFEFTPDSGAGISDTCFPRFSVLKIELS